MSNVNGIVLCVTKNIFSFKGVATNHKSTINILFVCTWPLLFYCNINTNTTNTCYHFVCVYPVVLNLLVSLIMCYIILSNVSYLMLLTIVVLDCCMGMEHFILWLLEIAAD